MKPIISIITPSYNQGQFLEETIKSVLKQEGDFYIDYIVVDGASTDNSVEILKKYQKLLEEECEKEEIDGLSYYTSKGSHFKFSNCLGISYRWISEKDKGHANAVNKGLKMMKGDVWAFLNSDDIYEENAFETIINKFDDEINIVYGNGYFINKKSEITGLYPTLDINGNDLKNNCFICQPTVFLKREVYEKIGEFNENVISLDYEYWLRAESMGVKFKYIRPVLASSRIYGETLSNTKIKYIALENLAIVEHYAEKIPQSWKENLVGKISKIYNLLDFKKQVDVKVLKYFKKLFSNIYFQSVKSEIEKLRGGIFE